MILLIALFALPAQASPNPELTRYFSERIARMQASAAKLERGQDPQESMKLEKVTIGVVPQVSFGLSGVLNLTVAPEIDFVLTPDEEAQILPVVASDPK